MDSGPYHLCNTIIHTGLSQFDNRCQTPTLKGGI